jgi:hypothetical protein
MKTLFTLASGLVGIVAAGAVLAQSTSPPAAPATQPSDPSAASSPHQRAATKSPASEATPNSEGNPSDASTPHQKQVTKKKSKPEPAPATPPSS